MPVFHRPCTVQIVEVICIMQEGQPVLRVLQILTLPRVLPTSTIARVVVVGSRQAILPCGRVSSVLKEDTVSTTAQSSVLPTRTALVT